MRFCTVVCNIVGSNSSITFVNLYYKIIGKHWRCVESRIESNAIWGAYCVQANRFVCNFIPFIYDDVRRCFILFFCAPWMCAHACCMQFWLSHIARRYVPCTYWVCNRYLCAIHDVVGMRNRSECRSEHLFKSQIKAASYGNFTNLNNTRRYSIRYTVHRLTITSIMLETILLNDFFFVVNFLFCIAYAKWFVEYA